MRGWFAGRLPDEWFTAPPTVTIDREELLVVGVLPTPDVGEGGDAALAAALAARIKGFREETRRTRMHVADEAEALWGRKVSWGATCGDRTELFTTQSVPVMTRLRMAERDGLDTMSDAGVAGSRSEALAGCVSMVGRHEQEWIEHLREETAKVDAVRAEGPSLD